MELMTLSASRLKTYSSCGKRYYYEYVERLDRKKNISLVLGSSFHKAVEMYYRAGVIPVKTFNEEWQQGIRENNLNNDMAVYTAGLDMLNKYDFSRQVKEVEVEFITPFPSVDNPICYIRGFLDQITDKGFVDLKTNRNKPTQVALDNDLQFIVYAKCFQLLYSSEPEECLWYQARTGRFMSANVIGPEKVDLACGVINRIIESSITGIYDKCPSYMCRFCPFREPCLGGRIKW